MPVIQISEIKVGTRYRKDMGDISALAKSIKEIGLLHPIVITPENLLVSGYRRVEAAKILKWHEIPTHVVNLGKIILGERDENTVRKDFCPSECVAIAKALKVVERKAAKERQGSRTDKHPGNLPECSKGETREKVASAVGIGYKTLAKAEQVVTAAEKEPQKFTSLVERMDSGKISVNEAFNTVKKEKQKEIAVKKAKENSGCLKYDIRLDDNTSSIDDASINLILTDPPYNISGTGKAAKQDGRIVSADFGTWDKKELPEYLSWLQSYFIQFHRILKTTGSFYIFLDKRLISFAWDMAVEAKLTPKNIIIWRKTNPVPQARRNYASATEFVLYGVKTSDFTFNPKETNLMHNIVEYPICAGKERTFHPTQKPISLLKHFIEISSNPGDMVLDCFAGSGSTGLAAREQKRNFILIEKNHEYVDLMKARLLDAAL